MSGAVVPRSFSEAASALAGAAAQGRTVRIVGGGTKLGWGRAKPRPRHSPQTELDGSRSGALRLHTAHLSRLVIADDRESATINAGTPLARAQAMCARSGRMLAIDPQLGLLSAAATIGGVIATADSGPLSHGYGPPRDQILSITAALSDGRIVRASTGLDRTEDGFDVATLFTGAHGTLGLLLAVQVRLRPLPMRTATALASSAEPDRLLAAATLVANRHPELQALDLAWRAGRGGLLAQLAGEDAEARATRVTATMIDAGLELPSVRTDDVELWARQRSGQRSGDRAVLRLHHRPRELADVVGLTDQIGGTLVGRAALGISYLTLDPMQIGLVRRELPSGTGSVLLDLPSDAPDDVDPWGAPVSLPLELMRELKSSFDAAGICNSGIFASGI